MRVLDNVFSSLYQISSKVVLESSLTTLIRFVWTRHSPFGAGARLQTSLLGEVVHKVDELGGVSGWHVASFLEAVDNIGAEMELVEVDLHLSAIWVLLLFHAVQADRLDVIDGDGVVWVVQLGRS